MNSIYDDICVLFNSAGISNFEKLPDDNSERGEFAKCFKELNAYLEATKIQGFNWNKSKYEFSNGKGVFSTIGGCNDSAIQNKYKST